MANIVTRSAVALGAALGLAAVTACSTGATTGATPSPGAGTGAAVSFKTDVAPLLSSSCNGCHSQGAPGSQFFVMFDAAGAVNYANVKNEIGDIVNQTKSGRMPQGRPKLSADQLAILTNWQAAGTPDN